MCLELQAGLITDNPDLCRFLTMQKRIKNMFTKNALCQALKIVKPAITRHELFALLKCGSGVTQVNRYWRETYNIKPWNTRTEAEQNKALSAARELINK